MTYKEEGNNTLQNWVEHLSDVKQMLRSSDRLLPAQNTSDMWAHLSDPELLSNLQVSIANPLWELASRKGKGKFYLS